MFYIKNLYLNGMLYNEKLHQNIEEQFGSNLGRLLHMFLQLSLTLDLQWRSIVSYFVLFKAGIGGRSSSVYLHYSHIYVISILKLQPYNSVFLIICWPDNVEIADLAQPNRYDQMQFT